MRIIDWVFVAVIIGQIFLNILQTTINKNALEIDSMFLKLVSEEVLK